MSQGTIRYNRTVRKFAFRLLAWGIVTAVLTGLSLAYCEQFCMDGDGYGFPFAIFHPSHGVAAWSFQFEPKAKSHGMELDFLNLFGDMIYWSVFALGISYLFWNRSDLEWLFKARPIVEPEATSDSAAADKRPLRHVRIALCAVDDSVLEQKANESNEARRVQSPQSRSEIRTSFPSLPSV